MIANVSQMFANANHEKIKLKMLYYSRHHHFHVASTVSAVRRTNAWMWKKNMRMMP